jgi:hypothetical protein
MKNMAFAIVMALTALGSSAYALKDGDVLPCGKIYRSSTQTLVPDKKTNAWYTRGTNPVQSGALYPGQGDGVYKNN